MVTAGRVRHTLGHWSPRLLAALAAETAGAGATMAAPSLPPCYLKMHFFLVYFSTTAF